MRRQLISQNIINKMGYPAMKTIRSRLNNWATTQAKVAKTQPQKIPLTDDIFDSWS